VLALVMTYLMVFNNLVGPINLLVCAICLTLMFFEAVFGICVGCKLYNVFNKEQAQLCPGGVCEMPASALPAVTLAQSVVLLVFAGLSIVLAQAIVKTASSERVQPPAAKLQGPPLSPSQEAAEAERCRVPEFAKAMGHEAKWKLHNNCPS
jgi:hypothetical protein